MHNFVKEPKDKEEEQNIENDFSHKKRAKTEQKKNYIKDFVVIEEEEKKQLFKEYIEDKEKKGLISEEEKKEKAGLLKIFRRLEEDLESDELETLNQIYGQYINNEDITQRNIKLNTHRRTLFFMFYVISPIFGIINLIGIFETITMMNILFEILKNAIVAYYYSTQLESYQITKFSLNDFHKKYNFYNMFFEDTKKESFDFNLMMFTAFLGDILLKARGFRVSIFIFSLINLFSIFLILNISFTIYDQNYNNYAFFDILLILLCWVLLFLGVGASALLSQKIIIDSNSKYNKYLTKLNEESSKIYGKRKELGEKKKREKDKLKGKEKIQESEENENIKELMDILDKEENKGSDEGNDEEGDEYSVRTVRTIGSGLIKRIKLNMNKEKEKVQEQEIKEEEDKEENKDLNLMNISTEIDRVYRPPSIDLRRAQTLDDYNPKKIRKRRRLSKKNFNKEKSDYKGKTKFDSFFMICITTIIGYFIKYLINIILMEENNNEKDIYKSSGCNNSTCLDQILNDVNYSKTHINEFNSLRTAKFLNDQRSFYYIIYIYLLSIAGSIILYTFFVCIFTKNEKEKNNVGDKYRVCEIFGYTIYSEDISLKKKIPCCCGECIKLFCETSLHCVCMVINSLIHCFYKLINDEDNQGNYFKEADCNCLKCSFCEYHENDYEKNKEFFCYCYQTKRKQNWFKKFITSDVQKNIFPYMLEYFILKILTIAFEKQYLDYEEKKDSSQNSNTTESEINFERIFLSYNNSNNNQTSDDLNNNIFFNLKQKELDTFLVFIISFFLFFYLTLSFNTLLSFADDSKKENENKKNKLVGIKRISNGILDGIHGILIFDGTLSLIFSSLYLTNENIYIFRYQNFFLVPILMNKFYHFTLIYFCISFSEEKQKFDLISGASLISVYLLIWDFIISLIRNASSLNTLYIVQIIFASIPCFILLIIIILLIIALFMPEMTCSERFVYLGCLSSFLVCLGGFWCNEKIVDSSIRRLENCDCYCDCDCDCCEDNYFCFDFMNFFSGLTCCICCECCHGGICCNCCSCCECYDCCNCCSCFYCCGSECACYLCSN